VKNGHEEVFTASLLTFALPSNFTLVVTREHKRDVTPPFTEKSSYWSKVPSINFCFNDFSNNSLSLLLLHSYLPLKLHIPLISQDYVMLHFPYDYVTSTCQVLNPHCPHGSAIRRVEWLFFSLYSNNSAKEELYANERNTT